jgi:hypothetical protein
MSRELEEQLTEASNVLLLGSMLDDTTKELHNSLLSQEATDGEDVLAITFQSPEHWLRTWTDRPEEHVGDIVIITFSETPSRSQSLPAGVSTVTVNPTDLTGVGITLSDYLSDWAESGDGTIICFESLTELMQYTDLKPLFRFLRVITRRIEHVGGFAHFHLDPSAHDRQTLATIRSPFDAIVDAGSGNGITVSTRY